MLNFFVEHGATLLELAVIIASAAVVVTKLTPSQTDDEWAAKVKEFVEQAVSKKQ
jgi:hypothetical protein